MVTGMSEKRFIIVKSIYDYSALVDKERKDTKQILILSLHKEQLGAVCDLLNEQQATISRLEEKNGALKKFIKDNFDEMMDSKMVIDDEL